MWLFAFTVAAAAAALNVWLFTLYGHGYSLACALFCGLFALFDLVMAAVNDR